MNGLELLWVVATILIASTLAPCSLGSVQEPNDLFIYSDERIKSNVVPVDTEESLKQIVDLKVCMFDYNYEQFYNPLFGKRTVGLVAQQVSKVLPGAVGVVKKRKIQTGNGNFVELEDLHVLNQDALYMTHLGATQELARKNSELEKDIHRFHGQFQAVEANYSVVGQQVDLAMKDVKERQEKLELLATSAFSKSELATNEVQGIKTTTQKSIMALELKDEAIEADILMLQKGKETMMDQLNKDISRKLQVTESALEAKLNQGVKLAQDADKKVNDTITKFNDVNATTATLHKAFSDLGKSFELAQVRTRESLDNHDTRLTKVENDSKALGEQMNVLDTEQKRLQSVVDDTKLLFSQSEENVEKSLKSNKIELQASVDKVQSNLDNFKSDSVSQGASMETRADFLEAQVEKIQTALETLGIETKERIQEEFMLGIEHSKNHTNDSIDKASRSLQENVATNMKELRGTDLELQQAQETLKDAIEALRVEVHKQAAAEVIERRKILEAEVALQNAKIEEVRTRAEEERRTSEFIAQQEIEKDKRFNETVVKRVEFEETMKRQRELDVLAAQEESAKRIRDHHTESEIKLTAAQAENEIRKIESERETKLATVRLEKEAEAEQERQNKDIRQELALLQAAEERKRVVEAIRTGFQEMINTVTWLGESPRIVVGAALTLIAVFSAVYVARELSIVMRRRIEQMLGRPALVRESSQSSSLFRFLPGISWLFTILHKAIIRPVVTFISSPVSKAGDKVNKPAQHLSTSMDISDAFSGVVLADETFEQIKRISVSTSTAHSRRSPLRHVLFYGPPGTGKTMVAKRMAKWSGLDYAIMSGADVAPLQEQAVTEIHALFHWAKRTRKGVLLFIDEADAFLCSRNNAKLSESARNALTALLYHTGSASCNVMLVLATNRPRDIDSAVIDRIDESVQFCKPGLSERVNLVQYYYDKEIASHSLQKYLKDVEQRNSANTIERFVRFLRENLFSRSKIHVGSLIKVDNVSAATLRKVAEQLDDFSGREIAKLFVTLQAHAFGSIERVTTTGETKDAHGWRSPRSGQTIRGPTLNQNTLLAVVQEVVARHNAVKTYAKEV